MPRHVIVVDDNSGDLGFIEEVFGEAVKGASIETALDGAAALVRLKDVHRPRPDLVILDLNMPRVNGWQVLAAMRRDPRLADIYVVILTSSANLNEQRRAGQLGANCFITKPSELRGFTSAVEEIARFWTQVANQPPPPPPE